jgi:hypothetical protein
MSLVVLLGIISLGISAMINDVFVIYLVLFLALGYVYSAPPIQLKKRFFLKQLTIGLGGLIAAVATGDVWSALVFHLKCGTYTARGFTRHRRGSQDGAEHLSRGVGSPPHDYAGVSDNGCHPCADLDELRVDWFQRHLPNTGDVFLSDVWCVGVPDVESVAEPRLCGASLH